MTTWCRRSSRGQPALRAVGAAAPLALMLSCSGAPLDEVDQVQDEVRVCPGATTVEGIDVSYYQQTINWSQVKAAGIHYAVTRISDGLNFPDSQFATNWAGIKSVGLIRGAYQYFEPAQDA